MMRSFIIVCLAYVIALTAAYFAYSYFQQRNADVILNTFLADVMATIVIFLFSVLVRNASMYDSYWSLIPPFIIWYWGNEINHASLRYYLILTVVLLWSVRLTLNWSRRWKGLNDEDFRYKDLRMKSGKLYPIVNLLGIHLFPTIIVFVSLLPAFYAISASNQAISYFDCAAASVCIIAIGIELIADEQLKLFLKKRKNENEFISSGLWKFSRHPNYFGEVLFWWGIFLFAIGRSTQLWWTAFGAVAMTLMFVFISIPMMDKRMIERKPDYKEEMKSVSALFFWVRRK